jgi:translocation and assembly module TamB
MKKGIFWLIGVPVALLLLLAAGGGVLLGTQAGLRWSLKLAAGHVPGTLHIARAEGCLAGPLTLYGVDYHHDGTDLTLDTVRLDWSPLALTEGILRIDMLHVGGGRLTLTAPAASSSKSSPALPPFAVQLADGRLQNVSVVRAGSKPVDIRQLALQGVLRKDHLTIDTLTVTLPNASAHLSGTLGLAPEAQTLLDFAWRAEPAGMLPASGKGILKGNWSLLNIDQDLAQPTPVHVTLKIEEPLRELHWKLGLIVPPFQLQKIVPGWGPGTLEAKLHAQGTLTGCAVDGTLSTDVGAQKPYPLTLAAQLSRQPEGIIRIARLAVSLPEQGAALNVTGTLRETDRSFDLHATWEKAGWPLHGTPAVSSTAGRADLTGTPADYQLGVEARLRGKGIPAGQWQIRGRGDEKHLQIETLHADLLKGSLDGSGTLGWEPRPAWNLDISARDLDPAVQWPDWPGRVTARLRTSGRVGPDGPRGEVMLSDLGGRLRGYSFPGAQGLHPLTLSAELSRQPEGIIRIARLTVSLPEQGSALNVTGTLKEIDRSFDLHAAWEQAGWPLRGPPAVSSTAGRADLTGTPADYQLGVEARLSGKGIPAGQWRIRGRGDEKHLQIETLHADLLGGRLDGSGMLEWEPKFTWKMDMSTRDIDPADQWPAWPGQVSAHLETSGHMEPDGPHGDVALSSLGGKLRGYPLKGGAEIRVAGEALKLRHLQLESGKARFSAQGNAGRRVRLTWSLDTPQLGMLIPDWQGSLSGSGMVTGLRNMPRFTAKLRGSKIAGRSLRLADVSADIDAGFDLAQHGAIRVQAGGLTISGRRFDEAVLKADGNKSRQQLSLTAHGPDALLEIRGDGRLESEGWAGRLNRAHVRLAGIGEWTLVQPAVLHIDARHRSLKDACWQNGEGRFCFNADQTVGQRWTVNVAGHRLPLAGLAGIVPSDIHVNGVAGFKLQAAQTEGRPLQALATLSLSSGSLRYRASNGKEIPLDYGGGKLEASLDENGLDVTGAFELGGSDRIHVDFRAPGFATGEPALRRQPIRGSVHAHFDKLGLLADMTGEIGEPAGVIDLNLKLAGTLAKPQVQGSIKLENGAFDVLPMGVKVRQVSLRAAVDSSGKLQFHGQARSGKGSMKINGIGNIAGVDTWESELHLEGQDFEAADTSDAHVWVSPNLTLSARPGHIDVQGEVKVPEAQIHPKQMAAGTVRVSPDVVIVSGGKPVKATPVWEVSTRVRLILGEKVHFKGFGLTGLLTGDVQVIDRPGTLTTGRGQVSIKSGTYRAYGQDLTIERGQFLFAGGPIENPGINARAVRQIGSTTSAGGVITVGVQVAGTAKNPQLTLFSTPAMSQSETLSYLFTGHGLSGTSRSEGQLLMAAASSLGIKGGNLLADTIGRVFGLQEARIESGATLQQSSLVLGKYLLPDLYVSYSVGFAETVNELRIRYQFAKHWALETESGLERGGDLLFTLER